MLKNNISPILAEGQKTFDEALKDLQTIVVAEVPIVQADKVGGKAMIHELNNMEFLMNNVAKVDPELPKGFELNTFADDDALLKEKKRQLAELKLLQAQIENQIVVIRIRIKDNVKEMYKAAEKAIKRDITLAYIYDTMKEWYAVATKKEDKTKTDGKSADTKTATAPESVKDA